MTEDSYSSYTKNNKRMILRDYLAIDRTLLANETSFMAYVRTSLAMVMAGVAIIKFFDSEYMQAVGWTFVTVGGWLSVHGYRRYKQMDHLMHDVKDGSTESHTIQITSWSPASFQKVWRRDS